MKTAACAISAGSPSRLSGTGAVTFSSMSGGMPASRSVRVKPGAIEAARMPKRASSRDHATAIAVTPALAAE
jgi:hypothetical protein